MRILALDTSQLQAAVALLDGDAGALKIMEAAVGSTSVSHSESILPLIDEVLTRALGRVSERLPGCMSVGGLDAFAVGAGPGSFTGVRIGCATVKALAQAVSKPVVAFSSLKALAYSAVDSIGPDCCALVNAYQGLVFAGAVEGGAWREQAVSATEFCRRVFAVGSGGKSHRGFLFCGSGAHLYWKDIEAIAREAGVKARLSDVQWAAPEGVARAVAEELARGETALKNYSNISANYLRASQAEIKLSQSRTS